MKIIRNCKCFSKDFITVKDITDNDSNDIVISILQHNKRSAVVLSKEDAIEYFETILVLLKN